MCRSRPSRRTRGCGWTSISITRSPGGPPRAPGAPLPGTRIIEPLSAPGGMRTRTVPWLGNVERDLGALRSPGGDPSASPRACPDLAKVRGAGRTAPRSRTRPAARRSRWARRCRVSCQLCVLARLLGIEAALQRRVAELVVRGALLGVGEHLVRRRDALELVLGGFVARVHVGMMFACELAIRLADRILRSAPFATPRMSYRVSATPRRCPDSGPMQSERSDQRHRFSRLDRAPGTASSSPERRRSR